nr:ribulose-phosphate 3-epimerase [uncultured Oscillibacter sp.]
MIRLIPSLASADPLDLRGAIDSVPEAGMLHMDIEDGNFIPNITFGLRTVEAVSGRYPDRRLDVHLMVSDPGAYLEGLLEAGAARIAFQVEAASYPAALLSRIRAGGAQAGLAFDLRTPLELAGIYADRLDHVLLMTAEPDGEGQRFNPWALSRIARARAILPERVGIAVDGGISPELLPQVVRAGADTVVLGRAVWGAERPGERYRELTALADEVRRG